MRARAEAAHSSMSMESGRSWSIDSYLNEHFDIPAKNPPGEARLRWRRAVGLVVRNRRRRFRMFSGLHALDDAHRRKILGKVQVVINVHKAALQFIDGVKRYHLSQELIEEGFCISPDELAAITGIREDSTMFKTHGGIGGISRKIKASLEDGVMETETTTRQKLYGTNKHAEKPPRSFWMFVWDALHDLTLIILVVCAMVSLVVGLATEGWPKGIYDGLGIILSILLVVLVTASSDYKQSRKFMELDREKQKIYVLVTRDSKTKKVLIHDLVVGDILHLSIGDVVPADGLFISGYCLVIDESSLSGESEPVRVSEEKPFLHAGSKVVDGTAKMLVTAVGMRTEWGKIMDSLNEDGVDETPLQVKLNGVATIIGHIGLVFAILTFLVLLVRFLVDKGMHVGLLNWSANDALTIVNYFAIAVTIIVVAVPEGLPLAVTLSLAFAMKKLMNDKALVRHLAACETMGSASCICTDKTGTLTTNHMIVDKVWISDVSKSVNGDTNMNELKAAISERVMTILIQGIFMNTGSEVVKGDDDKKTILGTPTEAALLEFGLSLQGDIYDEYNKFARVRIEPFNSVKKKMSVLIQLPNGGLRSFCKGASEIILGQCDSVLNSEGNITPLSEMQKQNVLNIINSFASEALRTLCIAFKDLNEISDDQTIPEDGYTLIALFGIKDPVRPGVRDAVMTCMAAGITVRMVTGDNINTAKAIAKECGILTEDGIAIEGREIHDKSTDELKELLPKIQVMARSLPMDKYKLVTSLKSMYQEVVAVTGDGTNDAPALRESDIGLAMGIAGTEVAKENADVIIMDDNFSTIINVARWGRAVYLNIQKFVQFQLTVNIVALIVNFLSACIIGTAPLTAVQLLWVNMIMDTLGALALATEPPNDEMMKKSPVRRGDSFITQVMWRNILGQSLYQLLVLGILMFAGKRLLKIEGSDADRTINTLIFNSFVFCQVFNEVNSREMEKINVFRGIFNNWIFVSILTATVIFQVIIVEFLGTFANTVPLSWELWLLSVIFGSVSMIISVILKCIPVEDRKTDIKPHGYELIPEGPEAI
ncbi:probable calcium-transporting ATPase 6, plasma membrane-type isoform X1 [Phragmites australis]|uniref:probable calcium-transporting ATPase 6, plasma membrane-type isoform X1 n=1 Tax=Phragmites australis TaxID=29695 RepID=UPI002D797007|nr:probable calcium-transporting ATPase 6, plasma membrane-type isoform X1 [Phragmites australis]